MIPISGEKENSMSRSMSRKIGLFLRIGAAIVVMFYISYFASTPVAIKLDSVFEFQLFTKLPTWLMTSVVFLIITSYGFFIFTQIGKIFSKDHKAKNENKPIARSEEIVESEIAAIDVKIEKLTNMKELLVAEKEELRKKRYASATKNCKRGEFFDYSLKAEKKA